jgi:hypothetical protein
MKISTVLNTDDKYKEAFATILDKVDIIHKSVELIYADYLDQYQKSSIEAYFNEHKHENSESSVFQFTEDMSIEGTIRDNELNGEATITYKDGRSVKGNFKSNKYHGRVI